MSRFYCPVAFLPVEKAKCRMICDAMDNRTDGWNALPFGVTKTMWTQKRCRGCKHHQYPGKDDQ